MGKSSSGGNKKSSKKDQPKRKRYIADGRMWTNAIRNLEKHLEKYSREGQDAIATEALKRLKEKRRR